MIYLNTCREIVLDNLDIDDPDEFDAVDAALEAAKAVLDATEHDWECSSSFRDWRGGRHIQHHQRYGCVMAWSDGDHMELAESVSDAMDAAAAKSVTT